MRMRYGSWRPPLGSGLWRLRDYTAVYISNGATNVFFEAASTRTRMPSIQSLASAQIAGRCCTQVPRPRPRAPGPKSQYNQGPRSGRDQLTSSSSSPTPSIISLLDPSYRPPAASARLPPLPSRSLRPPSRPPACRCRGWRLLASRQAARS